MSYQTYNDTFEIMILACLIQGENTIKELRLQPKHFIKKYNAEMLELFITTYQRNGAIDLMLVASNATHPEEVVEFCSMLVDQGVIIANFQFYQDKQEENYKAHQINKIMLEFNSNFKDYQEMIDGIKAVESEFVKAIENTDLDEEAIYDLITSDSNILKFSQYKQIMHKIQLPENTVNVIAARTSVGKSGFALNLLNDLSNNYKCIYFNMEMTEKELWQRLAGMNSGLEINNFKDLNSDDQLQLRRAIRAVKQKKIKIINGSKTTKGLRSIITRESRECHVIAFIDYIGFVSNGKQNQGDTERIGEALREIQNMTKDHNATCFVLAQINRSGSDAPTLVNLKDSGELEQTAHCAMVLHDPVRDPTNQQPQLELLILKNRSGQLGKVYVSYNKATQKIYEVTNDRR